MADFTTIKNLAQDKALDAIHKGAPVAAREWLEVAGLADAIVGGRWPQTGATRRTIEEMVEELR